MEAFKHILWLNLDVNTEHKMRTPIPLPLVFAGLCLALLIISSRAQAQYRWHIMHSDYDGKVYYSFTSVSCSGDNCTAAALIFDATSTPKTVKIVLYRSNDGGQTWTMQDPGLPLQRSQSQNQITKIQQIDSLHAVGVGDTGLFIQTSDGGKTWTKQILGTGYYLIDVDFSDSLTGLVLGGGIDIIHTTSDGGKTWDSTSINPNNPDWFPPFIAHSYGGKKFCAISDFPGPIYRTDNNWVTVDSSYMVYPETDTIHYIRAANFTHGDTIVAYGITVGTNQLLMTRSVDNGASWNEITVAGNPLYRPQCMSSLEQNPVFVGGVGNNNIGMSTDHGTSWSVINMDIDSGSTYYYFSGLAVTNGGHAIATVAKSPQLGASGYILLGEPVSGVPTKSEIASVIAQFYPNPATTNLNIVSPKGASTVRLYDVLGRETLSGIALNGHAALDVSRLPRGVYSVVLEERDGTLMPVGKVAIQ
jgi:photosystem II stability/assembly factor-like uncharacterized protein